MHSELSNAKEDSIIKSIISPYKKPLDEKMDEAIAVSDTVLTKDGIESNLANFIMKALEQFVFDNYPGEVEFIIPVVNRGGIRTTLPKGEITVRNIFEILPFDNEIVFVTISGENLYNMLLSFCENQKLFSYYVSFSIENKTPTNIQIRGQDFDKSKKYLVITTDYLANGGDNTTCFSNPIKLENTGVKLRDAVISYCKFLTRINRHITSEHNGRITISE